MEVLLQTGCNCVRLCVVYRPPSLSKPQFLVDFSDYLDQNTTTSGKLLVLGDFNIQMDNETDTTARDMTDLIYSFNMDQHVNHVTHEKGHLLDLVITRAESNFISSLSVVPWAFSDHHVIKFHIPGKRRVEKRNTIKIRKLKDIDMEKLNEDIQNSILVKDPPQELEDLIECYNSTLTDILEKHAPLKEKVIRLQPRAPWYNNDIQKAKRERRKWERKYIKSRDNADAQILKEKHRAVQDMCDKAKKEYYNTKVNDAKNDQKELFKICNGLLHKTKNTSLPTHSSKKRTG